MIHDLARPAETLAAVHRALRSDGTFLMVDLKADSDPAQNASLPWAAFLYAFSTVHCMSVSLGQGGAGLGTAWGVQLAERMIREAGFGTVTSWIWRTTRSTRTSWRDPPHDVEPAVGSAAGGGRASVDA